MNRMKRLYVVLICLGLVSCNHVQWKKTTDGTYIYGKFPNNKDVVWEGRTLGPLAYGTGSTVILDKDGQVKKKDTVTTYLGAINDYNYVPTSVGLYLGKKKKSLPNGFGMLVRNDTLFMGKFKEGKLHEGEVGIYTIAEHVAIPVFTGIYRKGKPQGLGCIYENGNLLYSGSIKNGLKHGLGKDYVDGVLSFDGAYKKGLRDGVGREYKKGILSYEGEWCKGVRDGYGIAYNERGVIIYDGDWENDLYDGHGKLYENGQCVEGKWSEGRLVKSISSSTFKEISNATKMWFSNLDSLDLKDEKVVDDQPDLPGSQVDFIFQLQNEIEEYLTSHFDKRVGKRFGFWNLPRMIFQPWFKNDVKRANKAQNYFCKNVKSKDLQRLINAKVDYYNSNNPQDKLHYVSLDPIPSGAIVNTDVAIKVFEREAIETTDVLAGVLVDIIVCFAIAFIIGLIIGLFIHSLIPYVGIVDAVMSVVAVIIGLYLSLFRTAAVSMELEATIKQMLVDNYMLFLDNQNIILQILGL